MKRACILMVPALLLLAVVTGCQEEESKPVFTRMRVTPNCGVVPLSVEGYAILSGGNESGDPLGANNNLEIKWDWGDGGTGSSSIAYHTYNEAKSYTVIVTGTDPDGNTTSAKYPVTALSDSLRIEVVSIPPADSEGITHVTTADTVRFDMSAYSCDIDFPAVLGDSVKLEFLWEMGDADTTAYTVVEPEFRYATIGLKEVYVSVFYPAWAVVRKAALTIDVTDP